MHLFERFSAASGEEIGPREQARLKVGAFFDLLAEIHGPDRLVLKAGKLDALRLMRSGSLEDQLLALLRLVYEDPTLSGPPKPEEIEAVLEEIEDELAEIVARRTVEQKLEEKLASRMQQRHEEYMRELRMQILQEDSGPENAQTLKKLAELEIMEKTSLSHRAMEILRPRSLDEVVGQDKAIKALLAKLATPYPQHVLLYGPPGVGKTTVARLVLEEAKRRPYTPFSDKAPFVEVDGSTLRWDPREVTNPLLGSVHDPIYQGARRDLVEIGVPEPKPGLVTEAHGGVLFIDEVGELDPLLQNKLLKVLEDKRIFFESSYFDPDNPQVPKYIRKLFEEGAPADFVLIGATTRDPEYISPALRSRCVEVFFDPLTPEQIRQILHGAIERLGAKVSEEAVALISDYTIEGRKATAVLADAYSAALSRVMEETSKQHGSRGRKRSRGKAALVPKDLNIGAEHVLEVIQSSRLVPHSSVKASSTPEIGKAFALGVCGFLGSVIEIEAVAFPAREATKGNIRFNETAGSMAKDSVFNAATVVRSLTGKSLSDYDLHVNVVGGGAVDGPSAGAAILVAIISALEEVPVRQDTAVTGEVSLRGQVKPVGGLYEKVYAAKQVGMREVLMPLENARDLAGEVQGITVTPVGTIQEVLKKMLVRP